MIGSVPDDIVDRGELSPIDRSVVESTVHESFDELALTDWLFEQVDGVGDCCRALSIEF